MTKNERTKKNENKTINYDGEKNPTNIKIWNDKRKKDMNMEKICTCTLDLSVHSRQYDTTM